MRLLHAADVPLIPSYQTATILRFTPPAERETTARYSEMSFIRRHLQLTAVGVCCLAIGAGAGVVGTAGAASSQPARATSRHQHGAFRALAVHRLARRAVHGDLIVATKQGFVTISVDRGRVDSVNAQQLTIAEGTRKAIYKTVTLTIPSGARVRDNGKRSALASLTRGQRVTVIHAPNRTLVIARTPKHA